MGEEGGVGRSLISLPVSSLSQIFQRNDDAQHLRTEVK